MLLVVYTTKKNQFFQIDLNGKCQIFAANVALFLKLNFIEFHDRCVPRNLRIEEISISGVGWYFSLNLERILSPTCQEIAAN